jgi:hypothetical protein
MCIRDYPSAKVAYEILQQRLQCLPRIYQFIQKEGKTYQAMYRRLISQRKSIYTSIKFIHGHYLHCGLLSCVNDLSHNLPSVLRLLLYIEAPKPPKPLLKRLYQFLLVIHDSFETEAQQIRGLSASRNHSLTSWPASRVVCLESCHCVFCLRDLRITEEICKDVSIFNCLTCPGSLMRC